MDDPVPSTGNNRIQFTPPSMPPSTTPEPQLLSKNVIHQSPRRTRASQATSPIAKPTVLARSAATASEAGKDLTTIFKDDLSSIRSLVTCSICDQLLYEPFTIQCGHTYCYSCLCSWFVPNKKKKTCPECRTIIKQMPAPSFMIKQMVEILLMRVELMPPDESVEQHTTKRTEEIAAVEQDRCSEKGLFKGLFPARLREPIIDEADGVSRCPHCNVEYLGGSSCRNCGGEIDNDGFDMSGDDLDELEALEDDFQEELEAEFEDIDRTRQLPSFRRMHFGYPRFREHLRHQRFNHSSPSTTSNSDDSRDDEQSVGESEDGGSLQDFVVNDDSPESRRELTPRNLYSNNRVRVELNPASGARSRHLITISDEEEVGDVDDDDDDESDEGGPVARVRRRGQRGRASIPPAVPFIDGTDDEEDSVFDAGEGSHARERLRHDGWSPLHESENDDHSGLDTDLSDHTNDLTNNSDDESDTETMVGNDDDRGRRPYFWQQDHHVAGISGLDGHDDDDSSEDGMSNNMDHDGDTDMSVSSENPDYAGDYNYGNYPDSEASQEDTGLGIEDYEGQYDRHPFGTEAAELGNGHDMHDLDDDASDDSSPQPVRRRRAQPPTADLEHQRLMNRMYLRYQAPREPPSAASTLRRIQQRNVPLRLTHARWRARSPAVTQVASSSNRPNRIERQYLHGRPIMRIQSYYS